MNTRTRFTRHQVPRGTLPSAEVGNRLVLIKKVSLLRATYQVRLLLFRAQQEGKKLVLALPKSAKLSRGLSQLKREHRGTLVVERT